MTVPSGSLLHPVWGGEKKKILKDVTCLDGWQSDVPKCQTNCVEARGCGTALCAQFNVSVLDKLDKYIVRTRTCIYTIHDLCMHESFVRLVRGVACTCMVNLWYIIIRGVYLNWWFFFFLGGGRGEEKGGHSQFYFLNVCKLTLTFLPVPFCEATIVNTLIGIIVLSKYVFLYFPFSLVYLFVLSLFLRPPLWINIYAFKKKVWQTQTESTFWLGYTLLSVLFPSVQ